MSNKDKVSIVTGHVILRMYRYMNTSLLLLNVTMESLERPWRAGACVHACMSVCVTLWRGGSILLKVSKV